MTKEDLIIIRETLNSIEEIYTVLDGKRKDLAVLDFKVRELIKQESKYKENEIIPVENLTGSSPACEESMY